eukprot:TRINITY_DN47474_c0_g1_i1.p1 TRINITY_DN47474_c0_g1~~TRINITY_DN47474_c0_g1_i1.p1  ORF type:complete len:451 (+),score=128.44 TRINITY_DN47474_c0_g1_i1:136-1488(+)
MLRLPTAGARAGAASAAGGARRSAAAAAVQQGPSVKAQLSNTIGYYISAQGRRLGHKNALRVPHQGVGWTYIDVKKNVDALAQGLMNQGIKPGDRILSVQPSVAEQMMVQFAAAKLGAVAVLLDPYSLTLESAAEALRTYQPTVVCIREWCEVPTADGGVRRRSTHEIFYQVMPEMDQTIGHMGWVISKTFPSVKLVMCSDYNLNLPGTQPMRNLLEWGPYGYYESRLRRIARLIHPDTPALALPSAGGVVYTHRNLMTQAYHAARHLGMTNDSRVGVAPGLGHVPAGAIIANMSSFAAGSCLSVCGEHLFHDAHVGNFLENLELDRCEGLFITKEQLALVTPAVSGSAQGVGKLQWVCVVGSAVDEKLASATKEAFKVDCVYSLGGPNEAACALFHAKLNGQQTSSVAPNAHAKAGGAQMKGPGIATQRWAASGLDPLKQDGQGFVQAQ